MTAPPSQAIPDPIDLHHLDRQTLGDAGLAGELLRLFVIQSRRYLERIESGDSEAGEAAHTLKGAARAVGAFRVADIAERLETVGQDDAERSSALNELRARIAEAARFIDAQQCRNEQA